MYKFYEETPISITELPQEWQSVSALEELNVFLQQSWENRSIFYDDHENNINSKQQFLTAVSRNVLRTNNYVGTIIFKGQAVNIFPKIFRKTRGNADTDELTINHLMHNIGLWVSYYNKFAYPYLDVTSDFLDSADLRDLFVLLYVRYVKKILDRGMHYKYEEITEETSTVKDRIDVADYYVKKIPTGRHDKIQCTYSSFELDNPLNRIIKCTCKYLIRTATPISQKIIRQILFKLNEVADVNCNPRDCDAVKLSRLHMHYGIILSMSKMFLLNKSVSNSSDDTNAFCFLFPTETLYEGFLGGFMQETLTGFAKVKMQASDLYLFDKMEYGDTNFGKGLLMRNDYLVETNDKRLFVLDAKYKELDKLSNSDRAAIGRLFMRDDLNQLLVYALSRGLEDAYLLYPLYRDEQDEQGAMKLTKNIPFKGKEHPIKIHIYRLPVVFEKNDDTTTERLSKLIKRIFE